MNQKETNYKTYNEIVTSNKTIQEIIEDKVISGSFGDSIELDGIDDEKLQI